MLVYQRVDEMIRVTTTSRNIMKTWSQFQPHGRENGEIMALASLGWWGFLGSATWLTTVYLCLSAKMITEVIWGSKIFGAWGRFEKHFRLFLFWGLALTTVSPKPKKKRGLRRLHVLCFFDTSDDSDDAAQTSRQLRNHHFPMVRITKNI